MAPRDRAAVAAFSDGVNAAAGAQPLPVEFRMLLYSPAPWTPQDSLAVALVASLELSGSWHDVFARDAAWRARGRRAYDALFPLSDARYDVTVTGARSATQTRTAILKAHRALGSNAWAAGAARSRDGHALLANDPHLDVTIPGIWYLVDLQSPQLHVAGATIPGLPGVVLGHNERLAWATTNAAMATSSLFEAGPAATKRLGDRTLPRALLARRARRILPNGARVRVPDDNDPSRLALVRWPVYAQTRSTIATALALDHARSVGDALKILARYRGSPQNFILADRQRHGRLSRRRPRSERSGLGALRASRPRSAQRLPADSLRATPRNRAQPRRRAALGKQQGLRAGLSLSLVGAVRAAVSRLSHRAAAERAPALRRELLRADAARHALAARSRARPPPGAPRA